MGVEDEKKIHCYNTSVEFVDGAEYKEIGQ